MARFIRMLLVSSRSTQPILSPHISPSEMPNIRAQREAKTVLVICIAMRVRTRALALLTESGFCRGAPFLGALMLAQGFLGSPSTVTASFMSWLSARKPLRAVAAARPLAWMTWSIIPVTSSWVTSPTLMPSRIPARQ